MGLTRVDVEPELPLVAQLAAPIQGPVVSTNRYHVVAGDEDAFVAAWRAEVSYLSRQPGYLGAELYRGIGGSKVFFNLASWQSAASLMAAGDSDRFRALIAAFPPSRCYPHLVQPIALDGDQAGR
ncbi:antibiotic biosynthesis monooxygenase family protein [Kribbella kalugense]|uniref:Heme-degrading monooxygenase HmoA n=1 Tax=Kribbella kalugense TaxID=2512221 RepID=A0A4V3G8T8_9ACTN|nr:antibiotic biosynthesis monooxygenase family protein [Kribbella kalugense]TDW24204.1 heme-degrading monooxygenase HmoA [Kribbella kalugense]